VLKVSIPRIHPNILQTNKKHQKMKSFKQQQYHHQTHPKSLDIEDREKWHKESQQLFFEKITQRVGANTRNLLLVSVLFLCLEIYILGFVFRRGVIGGNSTILYLVLFICTFLLVKDFHAQYIAKRYYDYHEEFHVKDRSRKPYVRLNSEYVKSDLRNLEDKNDILVHCKRIKLKIGYPLIHEYSELIDLEKDQEEVNRRKKGFTRLDIAQLITTRYAKIYKEEEEKSSILPNSLAVGRINHLQTNGPHGIWGWALSSLKLTGFFVKRSGENGDIEIIPSVESVGSANR
jgi:hypothetical protein